MAHFARLNENNSVVFVHVVDNINCLDSYGVEQEAIGVEYLKSLHGEGVWKQTSYNGNFRKQYCGVGYTYDSVNDVFIVPQPFLSWTLDSNFDWQAPVVRPSYDIAIQYALWNENNQVWDILDRPAE